MSRSDNHINRRKFLGHSVKAVAAASVASHVEAALAGSQVEPQVPEDISFIIDSHNHCGGTEQWVEEMVQTYRPRHAMACVLTRPNDLDLMREAITSYPDIFIGYGRTDLDDPEAVRHIELFKKHGFVGMKFHIGEKNYHDDRYFELYRLCETYGMYMLFHTGIGSRRITEVPTRRAPTGARPMFLDAICRRCPRAKVQGAHFGNPWYEEAAEAARWNPNLFFDVTGSTLLKFIKLGRLERMSEILWWSSTEAENNPHTLKGGPGAWEHIVFGTDERPVGLASNIERFQKMLDANKVPAATRKKMWGLTMAENLGIDPSTRKFIKQG
jgi:predicted TIM-barrel fold metal-dependent hydrolase